ncbi:MAG: molybdenum cofactor biosynthesis protein MoaE [Planctomycetota bacterium]
MDLTIRLFAGLRERAGAAELRLADLPETLDVAGLKRALEVRHPELGPLAGVRGVLGTRWVDDGTRIAPGDEVSLLPPVSGGAPGEDEAAARLEMGVFELSALPLDPLAVQRAVSRPACGAVVLFTGTTRATSGGRDVVELDYEAFGALAEAEMARIFAECRERFGSPAAGAADPSRRLLMLVRHRTGPVGIGEPSVVIAVGSPHRDAAFAACRFLIDELKARVPLWKKEVYAGGHTWVGERS